MNDFLLLLLVSLIGLFLSLTVTPLVGNFMKSIGKVGRDVHKLDQPEIPEAGGIGFMVIFVFALLFGFLVVPGTQIKGKLLLTFVVILLVTLLGLYDDFRGLSGKMKPLLLVIISLPVFFFRTYGGEIVTQPTPVLPFVGQTSLTIVYWLLAVFVIAIPSNASNMLDVMNGVMGFSGILIMTTAFLSSFIVPLDQATLFYIRYVSLSMIAVLLGFWWYNRYPATIFAGDTGSLGVGATIGLVAIYGRIEFIMVVALLVHIMNSFSIISSVGGLQERHEMKERPVLVEDGIISASTSPQAPLTLVRLLVARNPMREDQIVKQILLLVAYCCLLALLSAYLIRVELL